VDPADARLVAFKSHLRAETVPGDAVYLISERGLTALSGSSIERLAPLLDGTRTVAQVREELARVLPSDEVERLLARLSAANLIGFRSPETMGRGDRAAEAYWSLAGVAAPAQAAAGVAVVALGRAGEGPVVAACRASGLLVRRQAAFSLVLCDDYLDPALEAVNSGHLARGCPWLLARPDGAEVWVGPVFQPGAGPCWACLAKRLTANRYGELMVRGVLGIRGLAGPVPASLPAGRAAGVQLAVMEAAKWLAGLRHEGQQAVYVLDTVTLRGAHHRVARRPQCPACGDPELMARRAALPLPVTPPGGAGLRPLGPEQVLHEYGQLVDPITGIVPELRRHPGSPDVVHCYLAGRNRAMAVRDYSALRAGLARHAGGKGVTEPEAKAGALCEAVERYCATRDGDEATVRDSFRGLGDQAVHPDACQLFDERQFAGRAAWNATCAAFHHVPEPFDDRAVTEWTPAWSLLTRRPRLLPTALVYLDSGLSPRDASIVADSNGNAAGGSLEDAIVHGFLELVERDAVALWWYNRTRHPAVSLDSADDPWAAGLSERYRRLGRQVWVLDVTSDLGVPVMAAVSRRTGAPTEDIVIGFGAHPDPRLALRRALTELGQLLSFTAGAGADGAGYRTDDPHITAWLATATTGNQPYLLPGPGKAPQEPGHGGHLGLDRACAVARDAGLDILVVDQTRPDIGMPVVKVLVPGLRHFWPRFAPGRLFEVPVRLGRLTEPTAYDQLNPVPLYF